MNCRLKVSRRLLWNSEWLWILDSLENCVNPRVASQRLEMACPEKPEDNLCSASNEQIQSRMRVNLQHRNMGLTLKYDAHGTH